MGSGEPPLIIGQAVYGDARPDVAAARGQRFLNSGYHLAVSGQSPGEYLFVVSARSTTPGNPWTAHNINVTLDTPTVALTVNRGGTGTGAVSATGLTCPGGSNTQALPCGTSYALNTTVTLTAVPDAGSTFTGWNGACQTTQPACTVTLTGNRDVFATFTQTAGAVATTYYHTDAIGSVRALSDQTGATVIRHDYLPFGEDTQPLTGDPMRFAGKELDPESALMNFEARYYRNTWGRFTQVDPVQAEGALTNPQNWNRYTYAGNNPLRFIDPFGTCQYDPQTDRFTDTNGCESVTVVAPYPDVVGAPICYGYNANGEKYQQVSCSDQAIPGGGAYSGIGAQPGKSYPLVYPSATTLSIAPVPTVTPTPTTTPTPNPTPKPPPTVGAEPHETFFELLTDHPFQNPCITDALKAGALSAGLDAVGLIPEAGGFARMIGHGAGYRGVVADQLGASVINAFDKSASAMSGATNASDTSASGLTSTALTIAGFIPALGQVASGASLVLDTYKTINAIGQCRD